MEIEIQNTKADYIRFFNLNYFKRNREKLFIMTPILLVCAYNASLGQHHSLNWVEFALIVIIILSLLYLLPFLIYYIRLNYAVFKTPSAFEFKTIILLADKITIDSASKKVVLEWKNINSISKITDYTYLKLIDKKFILIPNRFFLSTGDAEVFYENLKSKISKSLKPEKTLTGAHLYWWGLLGFFPNFGVISGFVLLYKGIFTYKNNTLSAIGIASILFTFIFWTLISPRLFLLVQHAQ